MVENWIQWEVLVNLLINTGFHKRGNISWVSKWLSGSQGGFWYTKWINQFQDLRHHKNCQDTISLKPYFNPLAPTVWCTHHMVWCLKYQMTDTANGLYYDTPFKLWSATQQTGHLNPVSKGLIRFDQEHDSITWTTRSDGSKPCRWSRQKQVTSLHITETCNNNRIKFCSHFTTSWGCCL